MTNTGQYTNAMCTPNLVKKKKSAVKKKNIQFLL